MAHVNRPGDLAGLLMGVADLLVEKHAPQDTRLTYEFGRPFLEQAARQAARKVRRNGPVMTVLQRIAEMHHDGMAIEEQQRQAAQQRSFRARNEEELP